MTLAISGKDSRDLSRSILLGSVRFVLPAVLYLVLYRLVVTEWGLGLFGLWSLIAASLSYAALADIGFSQTLLREGGGDLPPESRQSLISDRNAAALFYLLLTLTIFLAGGLAISALAASLSPLNEIYSSEILIASMFGALAAACVKQIAKLDFAVLGSFGMNAEAFAIQTIGQFILLGVAFVLTISGFPIEGLVLGFLVSGIYELWHARRLLSRTGLFGEGVVPSERAGLGRAWSMIRRGRFLYISGLGLQIREPLFRAITVAFFGLVFAGFFDLALRAAKITRESAVAGFSSIYPHFARLVRSGDVAGIRELIRWTYGLVIVLGTIPLSLLVVFSRPIFQLWIGQADRPLLGAMAVLGVWMWLTLINIPFWHAALAYRHDRAAALSVWVHAAAVISLIVLIPLFQLTFYGCLAVWLVSSLATQLFILVLIVRKLDSLPALWAAVGHRTVLATLIILAAALVPGAYALDIRLATETVAAITALVIGLNLALLAISRSSLVQALRMMRGSTADSLK